MISCSARLQMESESRSDHHHHDASVADSDIMTRMIILSQVTVPLRLRLAVTQAAASEFQ